MASGTLTLGGIQYEIVALDKTKEGLDSAKDNLKGFERQNKDTLSNIIDDYGVLALKVTAALVLIQQGYQQTVGVAIAYQDQMEDMHNILGVSIEDAQKLRAAAIATDTNMGSLMVTMRYLTQRYTEQSEAGDNYRESLKKIGVEVKDQNGNWKDSTTVYLETIAALNKLPEGAERSSAAAQTLGRNWYGVADMISNADTATKEFQKTQSNLSEADAEKIDRFKVKWAQIAEKIELANANLGLFIIDYVEANKVLDTPITGDWDIIRPDSPLGRLLNLDKRGSATSGAGGRSGDVGTTGGADYTSSEQLAALGKTQDKVAASTKNLYLEMTDAEREIAYQTNVVIPKYTEALKEAESTGKGVEEAQYNLANAIDHLNDLKTQDTEQTKAQTDAYKEYKSAVEDLNDAKEKLYDLDMDYADEMQNAGMDVAAGRRATMSYNRQRRGLVGDLGEAELGVTEAATEFNEIKAGTPLEQVKGTEQYEKAQALSLGPITIENLNISSDTTESDFVTILTAGRIGKGVPISR